MRVKRRKGRERFRDFCVSEGLCPAAACATYWHFKTENYVSHLERVNWRKGHHKILVSPGEPFAEGWSLPFLVCGRKWKSLGRLKALEIGLSPFSVKATKMSCKESKIHFKFL